MEEILIVANNRFPLSYAATTRVYMLCRLFQSLGYETTVFITNVNENKRFHLKEENIYCRWFADEGKGPARFFRENKRMIKAVQKRKNLRYVILYQEILFQTASLIRTASEYGFEVIAYFDEWYEWGKLYGRNFLSEYAEMACIRISEYFTARKIRKKIVISRGLKRFYKRDDCLLLPAFVDLREGIWEKETFSCDDRIRILYAGWPGNRDNLRLLAEAVDELPAEKKNRFLVRIFAYKTTEEDLRAHIPDFDRIRRENRGIVEFCGEAEREQIIRETKSADFSYLLREDKWTNNAVFSTKVGESLASGTPMFANCTSDIGYYIKDGFNGVLIDSMSKEAVKRGLDKILGLSKEKRMRMRKNAYATAEKFFDYRKYAEQTKKFLERKPVQ